MPPKKPPTIFEVLFEGEDLYPEKIPLRTLSDSLAAIQRLATGNEIDAEEIEEEEEEDGSLRLVGVKRGSAIYQVAGPSSASPAMARGNLKMVGKLLENPEHADAQDDYMLSPIERLSTAARRLQCTITVREPGKRGAVLAKIEPVSYEAISRTLLITGETSFVGQVQRVGGATAVRCGLRVPFKNRMLICKVANSQIARKIGERLYQEIVVFGTANWLKNSWRLFSFTIKDVQQPSQGSILEAIEALREAGGSAWDAIEDPEAYLEEVSGER